MGKIHGGLFYPERCPERPALDRVKIGGEDKGARDAPGILPHRSDMPWSTLTIPNRGGPMSDEELKTELEQLRKENAALKKGAARGVSMKVSEKGGLSVYGMGRFPVTLYKEQWLKLLDLAGEIRAFIAEHESELKSKEPG
jgi:hypothetical protein